MEGLTWSIILVFSHSQIAYLAAFVLTTAYFSERITLVGSEGFTSGFDWYHLEKSMVMNF